MLGGCTGAATGVARLDAEGRLGEAGLERSSSVSLAAALPGSATVGAGRTAQRRARATSKSRRRPAMAGFARLLRPCNTAAFMLHGMHLPEEEDRRT